MYMAQSNDAPHKTRLIELIKLGATFHICFLRLASRMSITPISDSIVRLIVSRIKAAPQMSNSRPVGHRNWLRLHASRTNNSGTPQISITINPDTSAIKSRTFSRGLFSVLVLFNCVNTMSRNIHELSVDICIFHKSENADRLQVRIPRKKIFQ